MTHSVERLIAMGCLVVCPGVKPDDPDLTLIQEESSSSEQEARLPLPRYCCLVRSQVHTCPRPFSGPHVPSRCQESEESFARRTDADIDQVIAMRETRLVPYLETGSPCFTPHNSIPYYQ